MKSVYGFVIEPKGDRYNNIKKIGEKEPEDLTTVWPVIFGCATEDINLAYIEYKYQVEIINQQKVLKSLKHPFMRCTLDGSINDWNNNIAVIDAKFSLGRPFKGEEYADIDKRLVKTYTPQLHWNAYLLEEHLKKKVKVGLLSIIKAGNEPKIFEVPIDPNYTEYLIETAENFIYCIKNKIPPSIPKTIEPPIPHDERIDVDITQTKHNNKWKQNADIYVQTIGAYQSNIVAQKVLKDLVPKNAKRVFGNGLVVDVSKNNRKTIKSVGLG